ncbi:hypothetical protein PMG11_10991 [Penicillium brasilianum]|uniref:Uncharacterized protein n=1 Tax=Penicillium brasilianum TaxID=104259 RepID=A0A0F7U0R1_PENBI|nr:hypothetical protein PMG11_10991 [Penicillium brasilianum]
MAANYPLLLAEENRGTTMPQQTPPIPPELTQNQKKFGKMIHNLVRKPYQVSTFSFGVEEIRFQFPWFMRIPKVNDCVLEFLLRIIFGGPPKSVSTVEGDLK